MDRALRIESGGVMRSPAKAALLLAGPAAFLGFFFFAPLWQVLQLGLGASTWEWMQSDYVRWGVRVAVVQALWSVLLTMALALPLAWAYHRRRIRGSRLHMALHAAPFVMPVFVIVFGVQRLFGRDGWMHAWTGLDVLSIVGPMGAVVLAHAYYNYGFAARLIHAGLERRPHRLEEAAATLGAPPWHAVLRATWPAVWPQIVAVAALVFLFSLGSFGVVLYMGQGEVVTLETLLYSNLLGAFPNQDRAAALGLAQLAINMLVLGAYFWMLRRVRGQDAEPTHEAPAASPVAQVVAWAGITIASAPVLAVLAGGFRVRGEWSLEPWRALLDAGHPAHLAGFDLWDAVQRSLFYAGWSAAAAIGLALLLGYGMQHLRWGRGFAATLSALPLAASSVLIGFGLLMSYGARAWLDLRGTPWLVLVAHILVAFPFAARATLPPIIQRDRNLDKAASVLGARPGSVVWRVHVPMMRPVLLAAGGLSVALSLGDFGATLLVDFPSTRPLSVWIDAHGGVGTFNPLQRAQATALAGVLMVLTAAAYVLVERLPTGGRA